MNNVIMVEINTLNDLEDYMDDQKKILLNYISNQNTIKKNSYKIMNNLQNIKNLIPNISVQILEKSSIMKILDKFLSYSENIPKIKSQIIELNNLVRSLILSELFKWKEINSGTFSIETLDMSDYPTDDFDNDYSEINFNLFEENKNHRTKLENEIEIYESIVDTSFNYFKYVKKIENEFLMKKKKIEKPSKKISKIFPHKYN